MRRGGGNRERRKRREERARKSELEKKWRQKTLFHSPRNASRSPSSPHISLRVPPLTLYSISLFLFAQSNIAQAQIMLGIFFSCFYFSVKNAAARLRWGRQKECSLVKGV